MRPSFSAGMRSGCSRTQVRARPDRSPTRRKSRNASSPEKTSSDRENTLVAMALRLRSARNVSSIFDAMLAA
jgi:hypothetical protein